MFEATPAHAPAMTGDRVQHYAMNMGGCTVMMNDAMSDMPTSSAHAYMYVRDVDAVCKKAAEAGMPCGS